MKIGIIKEGKTPPDKRVPFTPKQCAQLQSEFPEIEVIVQESKVRAYSDEAYREAGIKVQADVSECDVLMGVKEVPLEMLIPNKKYFFFSHTYKEQPYNRELLAEILKKKIQLIDYELLKNKKGHRIIGFGRYAGIVGAYNALRGWGEMKNEFELKPAHECEDRVELERELKKVKLPSDFKMVMTGEGRVGQGAREIIDQLDITMVSAESYLKDSHSGPVFCQLDSSDYNKLPDNSPWVKTHFYKNPKQYISDFYRFAQASDMYIACHYWHHDAPQILTKEQLSKEDMRIRFISDISCDIEEPIASTLRPSKIASPFYGYDRQSGKEVAFGANGSIGVQAVDNLPCELPKDASLDFGNALIKNVIPHLLGSDEDQVILGASETNLQGELNEAFEYLKDYVAG